MTFKITFLDDSLGDYTPQTPRDHPLGGSQSALCFLGVTLAGMGVSVTLINGTREPRLERGVACIPPAAASWDGLRASDAVVVLNGCSTEALKRLRAVLDGGQKLILWTQHAADQTAVQNLADPDVRAAWDGFAFVSLWQMEAYRRAFAVDPRRCRILRNGVAPCFEDLVLPGGSIARTKPWPPVLAYTSTPFRGLDVLLDSFPRIRAAIPETRLQVFSGLEGYQVPIERDPYTALYRRCRETEGVAYFGGVSQTALAEALREANCLAYPNRFAETSCIAVMEAMAAGCLVLSSRLGALPETAAGFARLMPVPQDPAEHAVRFAELAVAALQQQRADPAAAGRHLQAQVEHVSAHMRWDIRAAAWLDWLEAMKRGEPAGLWTSLNGLLARIEESFARGDHDRVRQLCRLALVADPAHAQAWRRLGQAQACAARYTDAAGDLARAGMLGGPDIPQRYDGLTGILAGLARGDDSRPAAERIDAAERLAGLLPAGPETGMPVDPERAAGLADLADAMASLAREAAREGDFPAAQRAYGRLVALRPADSLARVALGWSQSQTGRHEEALRTIRHALAEGAGVLLASAEAKALIAACQDNAETALHNASAGQGACDPAVVARVYRHLGALADWVGEDSRQAMTAADAADALAMSGQDATARAAAVLASRSAAVLAARRTRQGRHAEALEILRRAAQRGGDPDAANALVTAMVGQGRRHLLEALGALLNAGLAEGAPRLADPRWQAEARAMIALVEGSLRLDHSDEESRSGSWATVRGFDAWLAYMTALPQMPAPAPAPAGGRRIYDCFQFYNELDLLELRLAELYAVVDRFVLVEATFTHAGERKPLHYAENRDRFAAYADKIVHVIVDDDPGGFAWEREAHQREAIARGLGDCNPSDMIVVSDADEIPRAPVLDRLRWEADGEARLFAPHLDIFLYFLDLKSPERWVGVAAAPWELIRRIGPNRARYLVKQRLGRIIPDAGWHFTWMGGAERFRAKLKAYAHREMMAGFEKNTVSNDARLEHFYATGTFGAGLVPGMWSSLVRVAVDDGFPATILRDLDRYRRMGWLSPASGTPVGDDAAPEGSSEAQHVARDRFELAHGHILGRRYAEAEAVLRDLIRLTPDSMGAWANLAVALKNLGRFSEAAAANHIALALAPAEPGILSNLGLALSQRDETLTKASLWLHRAITVKPGFADAWLNLGLVLRNLDRIAEAEAHCREAIAHRPDHAEAHTLLSTCLLLRGDMDAGFREYEWRTRMSDGQVRPRDLPSPLWDGRDPAGRTIIAHDEQGLGDSIQFVRYAPLLRSRGARVIVECSPPLARLFATLDGVDGVIARTDTPPRHDAHVSLLSLPHLLGTTLETVPAGVPYLRAEPALVESWRRRIEAAQVNHPLLRVGLIWAGNPDFKDDHWRSPGLAAMLPLAGVPGVQVFALQKGAGRRELDALRDRLPAGFTDLGAGIEDFADTAAIMMNLDLIISSCTAPPHLAGALARPVWTLLPATCDWRWLERGEASPWYPTMRLFRQRRRGDWAAVVAEARAALMVEVVKAAAAAARQS